MLLELALRILNLGTILRAASFTDNLLTPKAFFSLRTFITRFTTSLKRSIAALFLVANSLTSRDGSPNCST